MTLTFLLAAALGAADDDLTKAIEAVTGAESYRFTVASEGGGPAAAVEGTYRKGEPLSLKADRVEFFRRGEVLVYKQGDAWQRTRTGTLSDPLAILGASAKARSVRPPHEELALVRKVLGAAKKEETSRGVIFTGELSADDARGLARTEDRDLARGGTIHLWLDGRGRLTKYEIAIRVQGRRGNAEVDGTVTKTVTLSDVGTAKFEVPAAAKQALEGAKKE
jgi:hypothetical protein